MKALSLVLNKCIQVGMPFDVTEVGMLSSTWLVPFQLGCKGPEGDPPFQVFNNTNPGEIGWAGVWGSSTGRTLLPHSIRALCIWPKLVIYFT